MPGYYDRLPYDRSGQESYRTSGSLDRDSLGYSSSANGGRFRSTEGYTSNTGSYGMGSSSSGYQSRPSYSTGSGYSTGQGYNSSQGYSTSQGSAGYFSGSSSMGSSSSYGGVGSRYDSGSGGYGSSSSYNAPSSHGGAGYRSGVSPWQGGMSAPASGVSGGRNVQEGMLPTPRSSNMGSYMQGSGGRSDNVDIAGAVTQLQQMGNPESKLALNILSAVLGKADESTGGDWSGAPPSKMRRMDWDEGHGMRRGQALSSAMQAPPMRKYPQRDEYQAHRVWDSEPPQLAMASRPLSSAGPPKMGNDLNRRMARGRRGGRNINEPKSPAKDQSRGRREATGADRTSDGQRGKVSEGGPSATAGPKQSGPGADKPKTVGSGPAAGSAPRTPHQDIPKEALVCHMCKLSEFNSVGGYIRHLQTREHIDSATAYHNQSAAILQLLRSEAKLAVRRAIVKTKKGGKDQKLFYCAKCQCRVPGKLDEHYKSIEHILVNQYLKVRCCGKLFNVRGELEMHRLGLDHLKVQYELKKAREEEPKKIEEAEVGTEGVTEEEALEMFKTAAEEHKGRNGKEVFTPDTLLPYDPSQPVGLHLLGIRSHYRCKVCPNKVRLETEHQVLKHFRSIDHYHSLFDFIVNQQIEKRKKKMERTLEKATELINKSKDETEPKEEEEGEEKKAADTTDKSEEDADKPKEEADASKEGAETSKERTDTSKEEADTSKEEADISKEEADISKEDADKSKDEEEEEEAMETEEHGDDEKEAGDADNKDETRDPDEELDYEGFEEEPTLDEAGEDDDEEEEQEQEQEGQEEEDYQEEEEEEEQEEEYGDGEEEEEEEDC